MLRATLLSALVIAAGFGLSTQASGYKTFKSTKYRFSVRYPASWFILDHTVEVLDAISFPPSQRVKGVVLPKSGASITVVPAAVVSPPEGILTIEKWISMDVSDSKILNRKEVLPLSPAPRACAQLTQVEWEAEEGPNAYTHETSYYCLTRAGLFRIQLSNWRRDPKQPQYQGIALQIARSLRTW